MVPIRSNMAGLDSPNLCLGLWRKPGPACSRPRTLPVFDRGCDKGPISTCRARVPHWLPFHAGLLTIAMASLALASEPPSLFDRWLAAQTNLHTWTADVIQTRSLKVLSQPLVSTGKVWVVVPDRFRWELGQPAQTVALRLPDHLFLFYPRLKRAEKYPIAGAPPGPWKDALALLEASFPRSRAELESRFRVVIPPQTNSVAQLSLQPKSASARKFIREILIGLHTNDCSMAWTEMRFTEGWSLRNDFVNGVINPPLDPALFEPKMGSEVTIVEPLGRPPSAGVK